MPTKTHRAHGDTRTTSQRGYGPQHERTRRQHAPAIAAGHGRCTEPVCLMPTRWIAPGTPWDLAHDRAGGGYHGPAHRTCNRSEGARWLNTRRQPRRQYRTW